MYLTLFFAWQRELVKNLIFRPDFQSPSFIRFSRKIRNINVDTTVQEKKEIERKYQNPDEEMTGLLEVATRIWSQKRKDRNKIYSYEAAPTGQIRNIGFSELTNLTPTFGIGWSGVGVDARFILRPDPANFSDCEWGREFCRQR